MINVLDQTENNLVALRVSETITEEDYKVMIPMLEDKIYANGTIRLYLELKDVDGMELNAIWEDLKFDSKHADDFSKIALVGNKKWEEWLAKLSQPLSDGEIKYFDLADKQKALEWV